MNDVLQLTMLGSHPKMFREIANIRRLWLIVPDTGRTNVPLTCQFRPEHTTKFTAELQRFVFSFNRSNDEARDRMAFQGYRDTFNTRGKVRDHYNAITGEGNPANLPTLEFNIGFAGNVVAGTPTISDGTMDIRIGTPVLKLETININNPLPSGMTYETHPHLIHHEIITLGDKRNPFPQMGGKTREPFRPCYTPLMSKVDMYIEMDKLKEIHTGSRPPNPYNPAWDW